MQRWIWIGLVLVVGPAARALAGQAPGPASAPDIPVSGHDRVYLAEQFSNTVSVIDPARNQGLGLIRLGDAQPANLSPLYRGQLLVHGLGFSPDHRTLVVVSIGSNSVTFIDTATNAVKHVAYVGRSPHEAFFTPDGREVWVTVRGEDYVAVLDGRTYREKGRIRVPNGPGMTIFSPDGKYGYVCSSFTPETVVISTSDHRIVGRVKQASPFCPNIAATPEGDQVWFTLKDTGKVQVFQAKPPFQVIRVIDSGPITNHVNFVRTPQGRFAYVTVGGLNQVKVYRTEGDFAPVATIQVGDLPHGVWPSGDGTRVYVGLENADAVAAIDTATQRVIATIPGGQGGQAIVYVPGSVPQGEGAQNLMPLGAGHEAAHLQLGPPGGPAVTSVALFEQQLTQVLQAAVTGLEPKKRYVLALANEPQGAGPLEPVARFDTNPAGAAIVNAVGPIRQVVSPSQATPRRYLVIAPVADDGSAGSPVQLQRPTGSAPPVQARKPRPQQP
jgi:YVTN family beta-propeller protein